MLNAGSPEWAIWHVKAIGLPRLIDDLDRLEKTGYPESKCKVVKGALSQVIKVTEEATESYWRPCVSSDLQKYKDIYEKWNDRGEGVDLVDRAHRRKCISDMREVRKRMSNSLKKERQKREDSAQGEFGTDADKTVAVGIYAEFAKIVETHPDTFPGLKAAVTRFKSLSI
ncbi:hypothetical protein [Sphingomonas echinoides]|uniref:Uncharacterized protein n=1 Tax=Sphingomonas echinoides TaxID=59803 RepID=A0ABU4PL94_9SPHN|nr:hypothetical protein [Sphingomonas echinoides]MDX5983902.1 hypothetical protein [Sphingomonas echinoides]